MKLFQNNFNIRFLLILLFFLHYNIHANDDTDLIIFPQYDHTGLIYEFFANHPSLLYFVGIRHFYLGSEFGTVFRNGDFEDRFTNLIFIMPFYEEEGIIIEVDDKEVLDAFLFEYAPIGYESTSSPADKFELKDLSGMHSLLMHRYDILRHIERIRFQINNLAGINTYLLIYGIKIEK